MHLTIDGHLTQSQKDEANKLNITHTEHTQTVLQRLSDFNKKRVLANHDIITVVSSNPVIIIGHGPDWEKEASKIKGTKIPIIATEICSIPLMDMGIIPTYIVTYEEAYKTINEHLFDFKRIDKHGIQVIGSTITREWLDEELDKIEMDLYRYTKYEAKTVDNVGIFSCMFAEDDLKADRIIMIGMNSWGGIPKEGNPYVNWYVHWRKYIAKLPAGMIINCTQGGLLYGGNITECDFNNLVIKNGNMA